MSVVDLQKYRAGLQLGVENKKGAENKRVDASYKLRVYLQPEVKKNFVPICELRRDLQLG